MDDSGFSRRAFLAGSMAMPALAQQTGRAPVDYRKLISASDLIYDKPVPRSEEGIPIGNGRMGTLVWTTPTQVRMQINRVDVYANNCATNSFFERHNDYCGGCGYVDIDFGTEVADLRQHLSVYDGVLEMQGQNIAARVYAHPSQDVIAMASALAAGDGHAAHAAERDQVLRRSTGKHGARSRGDGAESQPHGGVAFACARAADCAHAGIPRGRLLLPVGGSDRGSRAGGGGALSERNRRVADGGRRGRRVHHPHRVGRQLRSARRRAGRGDAPDRRRGGRIRAGERATGGTTSGRAA